MDFMVFRQKDIRYKTSIIIEVKNPQQVTSCFREQVISKIFGLNNLKNKGGVKKNAETIVSRI
jgi:hypothetical protein